MTQPDSFAAAIAGSLDPENLHVFLLPTEECNFRCTYCYENSREGEMPPAVVSAVKTFLCRRLLDIRRLEISWFGGEPLLALPIIRDISSCILRSLDDHSHIRYCGAMSTNGSMLDQETFRELTALGIRHFQVSLDGPPEVHDKTRLSAKKGEGTFWTIWDNLCNIRSMDSVDATVVIRLHFFPGRVDDALPLVHMVDREFGSDKRFRLFLKAVERLGGLNDQIIPLVDDTEKAAAKTLLASHLQNPAMLWDVPDDFICYAAKPNSLVIRPNGAIVKCTVGLTAAINTIGMLNPDGTLQINNSRLQQWFAGLETQDPAFLACPFRTLKHLRLLPA